MDEVIEFDVLLVTVLTGLLHRDLIGDSSEADRGIVIGLDDEFFHLLQGILIGEFHVFGDIGYL